MSDTPFEHRSFGSRLMAIYGDQGCGKTSLIATAPLTFRIHVIDLDGGLESAQNAWIKRGGSPQNLTSASDITSFAKLHAAMWTLPPDKDLYVLDTYTTAMKLFKSHIQKDKIEITDWMKVGGKISGLAIDYFDHFRRQVLATKAWGLVLCQDKLKTIEPEVERLCLDLVGAAGRDVAGMVDFLLHYERQRVVGKDPDGKPSIVDWKRVLRTQETPATMAKDRSGALATPYEVCDLASLFTKIDKKRNSPTTT